MFTPFETQFWEIKQNHYDTVGILRSPVMPA